MAAEDDYNMFTELSKSVCESAEEAERFITHMMTKKGHKPVTTWLDGDEGSSGESKKDWWDAKPEGSRETRKVPRREGGGGSAGWQYGS
jgi:hypothetical protein